MKFFSKFLFVVFLAFFTKSLATEGVRNEEKKCLTPEEINSVLSTIKFYDLAIGWDRTTQIPACDEKNILNRTVRAILLLDAVAPYELPLLSNNKMARQTPGNFFRERIKLVLFQKTCHKGWGAYVNPDHNNTMNICPLLVKESPLRIASAFMHEARHVEGHEHIRCTRGVLARYEDPSVSGNCDQTWNQMGSYGIGVQFLLELLKVTKGSVARSELRQLIISDFLTRFESPPLDIQSGALLLEENGTVFFFNGKEQIPLSQLMPSSPTSRVVGLTTNQNYPVFYLEDGSVRIYRYNKEWLAGDGGYAGLFSELSAAERAQIKDVFFLDGVCFLLPTNLLCSQTGLSEAKKLDLSSLVITGIQNGEEYNSNFALVAANNQAYDLSFGIQELSGKKLNDLPLVQIAVGIKSWTTIDDVFYAVNPEGLIVSKNKSAQSSNSKWMPVEILKGKKIKKIIPFLYSKRLEEL